MVYSRQNLQKITIYHWARVYDYSIAVGAKTIKWLDFGEKSSLGFGLGLCVGQRSLASGGRARGGENHFGNGFGCRFGINLSKGTVHQ